MASFIDLSALTAIDSTTLVPTDTVVVVRPPAGGQPAVPYATTVANLTLEILGSLDKDKLAAIFDTYPTVRPTGTGKYWFNNGVFSKT